MEDIRWQQRLEHYLKALGQLEEAVALSRQRPLSKLEKQGLIKGFELTHELAWNLMKDWFEYQGKSDITGSRDATRESFRRGIVTDGEGWMEMIASRNRTVHTYNEATAEQIAERVVDLYSGLFRDFAEVMRERVHAG
ncbi:MAG: nucleotidyltransferase substrate binding protein [Rhodocyclaceae bacterium]|nr:nucleotidyltransferase substrate binding protein [Rhodocyclaceae bacterium]